MSNDAGTEADLAAIKPQHNVTITTERLYLRAIRPVEDIHALHRLRTDPAVMHFMTTGVETSPDPFRCHTFERIKLMAAPERFTFAIQLLAPTGTDDLANGRADAPPTTQASQPVIGFMGAMRPPMTGYLFDSAHWGRGYATEAYHAFLAAYWRNFPDGVPGVPTEQRDAVFAHVADVNPASRRVVEKCGFRAVGEEYVDIPGLGSLRHTIFCIDRPKPETEAAMARAPVPAEAIGLLT